jgi:malate dehydrogenase
MKITIVGGGGCVGSSVAFRLAQDGYASEIVLVDTRHNLAEAHALDIDQAVVHRSKARARAGETVDTAQSDIVIVAVDVLGRPPIVSRGMNLEPNLKLMVDLMGPLVEQSPTALWMIITNPVDVLVYLMHRIFSIPRKKIIGMNRNDTSRLRWAVAKTFSVPATDVEGYVLGEHGDSQVHVMSQVRIKGEKITLSAEQRQQIRNSALEFLPRWLKLQPGRTAGWSTAESAGDIFLSWASGDERIWVCSTPLEGEYGLRDVSLGVPVRLGPEGIKEIVQFDLEPTEREDLHTSAEKIKGMIAEGLAILQESAGRLDEMLRLLKGIRAR